MASMMDDLLIHPEGKTLEFKQLKGTGSGVAKVGPLGVKEIMEFLVLKHRPSFLANYLNPALSAGLVEMTQPDSPRSPTQKYRLRQKN
jgi:hypothetical protein